MQLTTSDPIQQELGESNPYSPSFVDRFRDAIERLPIPYWLTYLALFILESSTIHVLAWADGVFPTYTFNPILFLFPLWLWGPFAIMTYLDSISLQALSSFSPLLNISEKAMRRLKEEFGTMPAKIVLLSGVFWVIIYFVFWYLVYDSYVVAYRSGTFFTVLLILIGAITFFTGSAIYYHSIRQLRLVHRTVSMVKQFDLFRLDPVYTFSKVTSRTAIAWVFLLTLTLLLFPMQLALVPLLALLIVQVVLAISAFVLPLWSVHQRLDSEKRRLLAEHNQRVQSTLARLHRCLDRDELGEVAQLNNAIVGLNAEHGILEKIPTWPWRAGLLTGFLSIVVLPIITLLIQVQIDKMLRR